MVFKRGRGQTSGRSLSVENFVEKLLGVGVYKTYVKRESL